jgi:hypothetical protein
VTSRTVSHHVLEILSCLKKSRQLPEEELLRFSVELHRVIEATRCGAVVTRNAASTDDETIVDSYIRNLRPADILADSQPVLYAQIVGGHA